MKNPDLELPKEEALSLDKLKEAILEANRCLNCKVPACQKGCPIENDIPEFIGSLGRGDIGEARKIIARKSNLPAICGRVCAQEIQCEGRCVLSKSGKPVRIGMLEKTIADFAFQMELPLDKLVQKTRGKVAVIGSGPAGLTVAGDLAKEGFSVTVFESLPEPGGVLLYGIPSFRLSKKVVRREIQSIEALGVRFETNCIIGKDTTIDKMFEEGYDAICIATGTSIAMDLDLPGRELEGIIQSSYLLRMNYLHRSGQVARDEIPVKPGEQVAVIGGGNVAMDAARTAVRLGADVTVLCREDEENMPALEREYTEAKADGVSFKWCVSPTAFEGEDGKVGRVVLSGENGEEIFNAHRVFIAIGSRPANRIVSTTHGIDVDNNGYVIIKERPYGMSTRKGVFAGGDVVHQPASVVLAMREAKRVAVGISEYVDAIKLLEL